LIDAVSSWQQPSSSSTDSTDTYEAEVMQLLEEGTIEINGLSQPYQLLLVTVVEGPWAGETFQIDYGKTQIPAPGASIEVGDQVLVTVYQKVDGSWQAYFVDFVRTNAMLWLVALFAVASILLSGWKGVRSILSMLFSFGVIFGFIIPRILAGQNPVLVSTVGALLFWQSPSIWCMDGH
jgi:uncharacterized membrane protein